MTRVTRKNLMIDPEALSDLARRRGTSESQAARDAIALALGAQEMAEALRGLYEIGAFADFEDADLAKAKPPDFAG